MESDPFAYEGDGDGGGGGFLPGHPLQQKPLRHKLCPAKHAANIIWTRGAKNPDFFHKQQLRHS